MYTSNELNDDKQTKLTLSTSPFYGRRVKKFVFGLGIGIVYYYSKIPLKSYTDNKIFFSNQRTTELILSPTIRYYTKYQLFISGSFNLGKGIGKNTAPIFNTREVYYYNSTYTSNIIGGALTLGYAINAGKSFLIEPQITIQKMYYQRNNSVSTSVPSAFYGDYTYSEKINYLNVILGLGTIYRF
jgi:hypothetical protein